MNRDDRGAKVERSFVMDLVHFAGLVCVDASHHCIMTYAHRQLGQPMSQIVLRDGG